MGHSDVFGHLAFKRVYVRTERCDPIAGEGIFHQFKLFAAHVRRREIDAWQHRLIHVEQVKARPTLDCSARKHSVRQTLHRAQQDSDKRSVSSAAEVILHNAIAQREEAATDHFTVIHFYDEKLQQRSKARC